MAVGKAAPAKASRSKVVVLGETKVGKTTLMTRFTHPEDTPRDVYEPTIGIDYAAKAVKLPGGESTRLQIWDTAGHERYRALAAHYLQDADAVVVAYDVTTKQSFEAVGEWIGLVRNTFADKTPPLIVLVANKIDVVSQRVVSEDDGKELVRELQLHSYHETSATEGTNVDQLFQSLACTLTNAPTMMGLPLQDPLTDLAPGLQDVRSPKKCRCWPF